MLRKSAERGEGNLGCILWLVLLAIGVMVAWKAVPIKVKSAELYDYMDEIAKFEAGRRTQEEIEKALLNRANQLGLPLDKKGIHVDKQRDRIIIDVEYTVPLEFPGYTHQWKFKQHLDRPLFII
jgi:hypothetical protein